MDLIRPTSLIIDKVGLIIFLLKYSFDYRYGVIDIIL